MSIRVLITGVNGFAGCHLSRLLVEKGYDVYGTGIDSTNLEVISQYIPSGNIHVIDLREKQRIEVLIKTVAPDIIFHLAALSWVPASWQNTSLTFEVNLLGTINIFESILKYIPSCLCVLISTGDFYDPFEIPNGGVDENSRILPRNPYAISKMAADFLAKQYFFSRRLHTVILRPFNHIGPYQSESFVVSEFAKKIALAEKGMVEPVLKVGNLYAERDFTDVRDMVCAYEMAAKDCQNGECYNISSQKANRIGLLLDILLSNSKVNMHIEKDPEKFRPLEVKKLFGNSMKFRVATGWQPQIPIEKTVKDVLNYWRGKA